MARKFKSDVSEALHEMASGLHNAGHLDSKTMKNFDASCYVDSKPMSATRIKRIRTKEKVSQAIMAEYLQVETGTLSKWEQGKVKPNGPAHQLLNLIEKKGLEIFAA